MAKHRAISQHSLKGRTVIAGVLASGALMVAAPAAIALAAPTGPGGGGGGFRPVPGGQRVMARTTPGDAAIGRILESSPVGQRLVGELRQTPEGQKVLTHFGLGLLQY